MELHAWNQGLMGGSMPRQSGGGRHISRGGPPPGGNSTNRGPPHPGPHVTVPPPSRERHPAVDLDEFGEEEEFFEDDPSPPPDFGVELRDRISSEHKQKGTLSGFEV